MPKEYCHWVMAEKIRKALPPSSLKKIIQKNINLYRLGAVIPDSPLYHIPWKKREKFQNTAPRLHGNQGENTLSFIPSTVRHYGLKINSRIWAFLSGIVTHIATDSQYHPLVFYFCGNQHSHNPQISQGAVYRHRRWETNLDLFYMQNFPLPHNPKVDSLFRNIEMDPLEFFKLVHFYYFQNQPIRLKAAIQTLNWHRFLQKIFSNKNFFHFFDILNQFPSVYLDDFLALFYFPRKEIPASFHQKIIKYQHPVTGEPQAKSLKNIEDRVVKKAAVNLSIIDRSLSNKHPEREVEQLKGPSLSTGLDKSSIEEMIHFKIKPPDTLFNI